MTKPSLIFFGLIILGLICSCGSCSFLSSPEGKALEEEIVKVAIEIAEDEIEQVAD